MEQWKDIPGYEGFYQVSDLGKVRRRAGTPRAPKARELTPTKNAAGYMRVTLSKNGKASTHYVHRLVCHAFRGGCPSNHEVNHIDGNKANNVLSNLEYVTRTENLEHREEVLGVTNKGARHGNSKLTAAQVRAIRGLYGTTRTRDIARKFGIHPGYVHLIVNRRRWAWLD